MAEKFIVEYTNKDIMEKLEDIHLLASNTNGKVKRNVKLIYAIGGGLVSLTGYVVSHITGII